MTRLSEDDEASIGGEQSIPFNVTLPESLSFIGITHEQWNQLRRQVKSIEPSENLWFLFFSVCLTLGASFGIGSTQVGSAEDWIRTAFWMATVGGAVGATVCGIAGWQARGRRKNDIKAVLDYMDEIKPRDTE